MRPPPNQVRSDAESSIERRVRDEDAKAGIQEDERLSNGLDDRYTVVG